jgi:hypothetical protein
MFALIILFIAGLVGALVSAFLGEWYYLAAFGMSVVSTVLGMFTIQANRKLIKENYRLLRRLEEH